MLDTMPHVHMHAAGADEAGARGSVVSCAARRSAAALDHTSMRGMQWAAALVIQRILRGCKGRRLARARAADCQNLEQFRRQLGTVIVQLACRRALSRRRLQHASLIPFYTQGIAVTPLLPST